MNNSKGESSLAGIGLLIFIGICIWIFCVIFQFITVPSADNVTYDRIVNHQERMDQAYIIEHNCSVKSLHVQHGWEEDKTCWVCESGITITTTFDSLKQSDYDRYYLYIMQKDSIMQKLIMPKVKNTDTLFVLKSGTQIFKHVSGHFTTYPLNW